MKKEQVKRGMVVYDKHDREYVLLKTDAVPGGSVNTNRGWSWSSDLRPLTARERGGTQWVKP